jgi:methylated-DNA-[protein]-cysteine S-methyltransferase
MHRIACRVDAAGTRFQQRVWEQIAAIPPGDTVTYGRIAEAVHSSPRAVGNACRANPVPLRIPCHRVVGAAGLGGFAGERGGELLGIKRWLLAHEAAGKKARG